MSQKAIKRIVTKDMKQIDKNKLQESGIFIKFNEENILQASAMIIGPENTPYENGVLFFKIEFPINYPFSPPKIGYISPSKQRIHPNLYVGTLSNHYIGKVCLSILNTWSGPKWKPVMDISSIMLSILSLLDDKPIHHEPGYEKEDITSDRFKHYNRIIQYDTFYTLIYKNCFLDNEYKELFQEEINTHIKQNYSKIIKDINQLLALYPKKQEVSSIFYNSSISLMYSNLLSLLTKFDINYI
jgi:ubiquitin-conjugating enzyme E2 O